MFEELHMQIVTDRELRESVYGNAVSLARALWSKDNDIIPPGSPVLSIYYDIKRRQTEVYFRVKVP